MNLIGSAKEKDSENSIDYREFLEKISDLWAEVTQRDDTKTKLYTSMDEMLGDEKLDERYYKMWFSNPIEHLINANIPESRMKFRVWVMISSLQKATLQMVLYYEKTIVKATTKMGRSIAQLQNMEAILKTVVPPQIPADNEKE